LSTNFNPHLPPTSAPYESETVTPAPMPNASHAEQANTSNGPLPEENPGELVDSFYPPLPADYQPFPPLNTPLSLRPAPQQPASQSVGQRLKKMFRGGGGKTSAAGASSSAQAANPSGSPASSSRPLGYTYGQALAAKLGKNTADQYNNAARTSYPTLFPSTVDDELTKREYNKAGNAEAGNNELGEKLMRGGLGAQGWHTLDPSSYGATAQDDPLTKAAKWINSASNSARSSGTQVSETRAMLGDLQNKGVAFDSMNGLQEINSRVRGGVPAGSTSGRLRAPDAPYTSYAGTGAKVLENGLSWAEMAKAGNVPAGQRGAFVLGAVLRSHGFEDGNGRTARIAYALGQLQENPKKFDAIMPDYEYELSGLGK
jgi:hypothetical protein